MYKGNFIKRNFLSVTLSSTVVIGLSMVTWTSFKIFKTKEALKNKVVQAQTYQTSVIPLIKSKAQTVGKILKVAKIQDSKLEGILLHIPNWQVDSAKAMQEIEELSSYFDMYLSAHIDELELQSKTKVQVKNLLRELQEADRDLQTQRKNLKISLES